MALQTACWLLLCVPLVAGDPFIVDIAPGGTQCFTIVATQGQKVYGSYGVNWGGKLDIRPEITGPNHGVIYSMSEKEVKNQEGEEGSFGFYADEDGIYSLCLVNNGGVSLATKSVTFSLRVADELKSGGLHASKHFGSLEKAVSNIAVGLHSIQDHHHYMQVRFRYTQRTTGRTLSMVYVVMLCSCCAIWSVMGLQFHWITKLVKRRYR